MYCCALRPGPHKQGNLTYVDSNKLTAKWSAWPTHTHIHTPAHPHTPFEHPQRTSFVINCYSTTIISMRNVYRIIITFITGIAYFMQISSVQCSWNVKLYAVLVLTFTEFSIVKSSFIYFSVESNPIANILTISKHTIRQSESKAFFFSKFRRNFAKDLISFRNEYFHSTKQQQHNFLMKNACDFFYTLALDFIYKNFMVNRKLTEQVALRMEMSALSSVHKGLTCINGYLILVPLLSQKVDRNWIFNQVLLKLNIVVVNYVFEGSNLHETFRWKQLVDWSRVVPTWQKWNVQTSEFGLLSLCQIVFWYRIDELYVGGLGGICLSIKWFNGGAPTTRWAFSGFWGQGLLIDLEAFFPSRQRNHANCDAQQAFR